MDADERSFLLKLEEEDDIPHNRKSVSLYAG